VDAPPRRTAPPHPAAQECPSPTIRPTKGWMHPWWHP
jgi:hypothetical protein